MKPQVLEFRGYQGSVECSIEDGVLHGKILHIVDLVTYEAETPAGLREAFEEAVDDYLETCAEEGVSPDRPFSGTFNVRIGPEHHRRLAMAASREGLSLNDTVKRVLMTWLDECPNGFSVAHHHTHELRVVAPDDSTVIYRGAMPLRSTAPASKTTIPSKATMQ